MILWFLSSRCSQTFVPAVQAFGLFQQTSWPEPVLACCSLEEVSDAVSQVLHGADETTQNPLLIGDSWDYFLVLFFVVWNHPKATSGTYMYVQSIDMASKTWIHTYACIRVTPEVSWEFAAFCCPPHPTPIWTELLGRDNSHPPLTQARKRGVVHSC